MRLLKPAILLMILLIAANNYAQTVQLGIMIGKDNASLGLTKSNTPDINRFLSSIQVNGTYFISGNTAVDSRAGIVWEEYYKGYELGLLYRYYYKDLYGAGGMIYHHNFKESESGFRQSLETDIFLPALGLGFHPGRGFSVELLVMHGLNQTIDRSFEPPAVFDSYYHEFGSYYRNIPLRWVTKLSIGYSFSL